MKVRKISDPVHPKYLWIDDVFVKLSPSKLNFLYLKIKHLAIIGLCHRVYCLLHNFILFTS